MILFFSLHNFYHYIKSIYDLRQIAWNIELTDTIKETLPWLENEPRKIWNCCQNLRLSLCLQSDWVIKKDLFLSWLENHLPIVWKIRQKDKIKLFLDKIPGRNVLCWKEAWWQPSDVIIWDIKTLSPASQSTSLKKM